MNTPNGLITDTSKKNPLFRIIVVEFVVLCSVLAFVFRDEGFRIVETIFHKPVTAVKPAVSPKPTPEVQKAAEDVTDDIMPDNVNLLEESLVDRSNSKNGE